MAFATITFDPSPLKKDGTALQWDQAGKDKEETKNPYGAAKHELSHCIRLTHQGKLRSESGKIKDPQADETKGDDNPAITDDDKKEAKTASTAPIKKASGAGGSKKDLHILIPGFPYGLEFAVKTTNAELFIPATAFLDDVNVELRGASHFTLPFADRTPPDVGPILKGIVIGLIGHSKPPELNSQGEWSASIPYEDGREGEGHRIDLADPELGPVAEGDLRPFLYDPLSEQWRELSDFDPQAAFMRDEAANTVMFKLSAKALTLFPDPDDPNRRNLLVGLSGSLVPTLNIVFKAGMAEVSWPLRFTTYRLQASADLTAAKWEDISLTGPNLARLPATGQALFLRLIKP